MDYNQDRQMQEHDTDKVNLSDITRDPITQKVINKILLQLHYTINPNICQPLSKHFLKLDK